MELIIQIENVYGKQVVYPVCEKGLLLAKFKGQKTFTTNDIKTLKKIGYSFKLVSAYQHILDNINLF